MLLHFGIALGTLVGRETTFKSPCACEFSICQCSTAELPSAFYLARRALALTQQLKQTD
jgi:hypothetical protein